MRHHAAYYCQICSFECRALPIISAHLPAPGLRKFQPGELRSSLARPTALAMALPGRLLPQRRDEPFGFHKPRLENPSCSVDAHPIAG